MRHDYLSHHSSRIDNAIVTLSICLAVAMAIVPPVVACIRDEAPVIKGRPGTQ